MQLIYLLVVLSTVLGRANAARILSLFPAPLASQYAFVEPLLKELAARGHEITSISNYPQKENLKNFRDIVVAKNKHLFDEYHNFTIDINYYETILDLYACCFQVCRNILDEPVVRDIMKNEEYDLIILDVFFSEPFYGLSELWQAAMVGVSGYGSVMFVDDFVGNISPLSYIPDQNFTTKEMNFWQRLLNVALYCIEWILYYYKYMPVQKQIYNTYFPNATLTLEEARKNFAIVLLNDHFSLTQARPYVPNMIEVAGLNVITKPKPLTEDIKHLLNAAPQGVILVALDLDYNITKVFVKQFAKLSYLILWKTCHHISNKPTNIFFSNSLDLPSVMAHPNIKLHILEGTFPNVVQSVYYGKPLLGISGTGKECECVDFLKRVGNGLSLKLHTISDKSLAKALEQLLNTDYYANIAKTLSLRFRDQQNTPMERAVYWIEYVLRHNGAAHLKNRGHSLTWWQYYNIDVLAVIFALFTLVILLALSFLKIVGEIIWTIKLSEQNIREK